MTDDPPEDGGFRSTRRRTIRVLEQMTRNQDAYVFVRWCVSRHLLPSSSAVSLVQFSKRFFLPPSTVPHFRLCHCILGTFYPPPAIQGVDKTHDLSPSFLPPSLPLSIPLSSLPIEVVLRERVNQAVVSRRIPQQLDGRAWPLHRWDLGSREGQTYRHLLPPQAFSGGASC